MPDQALETCGWLVATWAEHFARALEAMAEEKPAAAIESHTLAPEDAGAEPGSMLWWDQEFSVAPGAHCWTGAGAGSWKEIGGRVLKAAGVEDNDPEGARSTYLEILNQSLSALAQALSDRLGGEVTCSSGVEAAPDAASGNAYAVRLTVGETECPVLVVFSEALVRALENGSEAGSANAAERARTAPASSAPAEKSVSMDLLLDVELPVSVSFGRAELALKDVLKLTTGSIIELNRAVSEPVEIIVNNCVIARGEVVVVEGNFGVRIRQVISRQERMRTLK